MSRRLLAGALALVAGLILFVTPAAEARVYGKQLRWLTSSTTFQSLFGDSGSFSEGSGQNVDTSLAVPIKSIRPYFYGGRVTAADSTHWFTVTITEDMGTQFTEGADSLYLGTQVSQDGLNWVTITPTRVFVATGKDGTLNGAILMEKATNTFAKSFPIQITLGRLNVAAENGTTAPTEIQLGDWKLARFLVQGDMTGRFYGEVVGDWED